MKLVTSAICIVAIGILAGCNSSTDPLDDSFFTASLTGANEVPAVNTIASGEADFEHDASAAELEYELAVDDIANATVAHIHLGEPGEDGPPIVFLFDPDDAISVTTPTVIATGTISAGDVLAVPGFSGTFSPLMQEIEAGNAYVNVHTLANPGGATEVRSWSPEDATGRDASS